MDLNVIKTIIDIIVEAIPVLKTIYTGVKSIFTDKPQIAGAITSNFTDITNAEVSEHKVDKERLQIFHDTARAVMPLAFVEYLYYATKVVAVLGLYWILAKYVIGRPKKSEK